MKIRRPAVLFLAAIVSLGTGALVGWVVDRPRPPQPGSYAAGQQRQSAVATTSPRPKESRTPLRGVKNAPRTPPGTSAVLVSRSWPNAASTGVRRGTRLTQRGSVQVTRDGTVINALDVRGEIEVIADNVTIRNTRVINPGGMWGIIQRQGHSGLTVEDSDIRGDGVRQMQYGILNQGGMLTVRRVDMSVISNGIQTNHGVIEDSYFHDPKFFSGDHTDMIIATGGPVPAQSLVIRHNTVLNSLAQTSAIGLFQDFGVVHDVLVTNNLLAGGGYALYAGGGSRGTAYNVRIIGNVFRRTPFRKAGRYGPVTAWDERGTGNKWRDNVWEGTRSPVRP